jgi:hypothetical protein
MAKQDAKCSKCQRTFSSLARLAIMQDLGAIVVPDPNTCVEGGEHDFVEPEPEAKAQPVYDPVEFVLGEVFKGKV